MSYRRYRELEEDREVVHGLRDGRYTGWRPDIKDEIVAAALQLLASDAQIRWPVDTCVTRTDATPVRGGTTSTVISNALVDQLYSLTEYKGVSRFSRWDPSRSFPS